MRGNIGNMMKQAQQMQTNKQKVQTENAHQKNTDETRDGMVKVLMTGKHEVKRVTIEPTVSGEDREMLEDLVAAAINDAVHKVGALISQKMAAVTAGMQLPPGMKLPF